MPPTAKNDPARLLKLARGAMSGPQALAFLPALTLAAFWLGGEVWLLITALGLPVVYAVAGTMMREKVIAPETEALDTRSLSGFDLAVRDALQNAAKAGQSTACIMVAIDDFSDVTDRYGAATAEMLTRKLAARLSSALRDEDPVLRLVNGQFGIVLAPMRLLDLETAIQIAGRLQRAVEEPLSLDATTIYLSSSVGFCLGARNPGPHSTSLLEASRAALHEAQLNGPSAIRAYTDRIRQPYGLAGLPADQAASALDSDQIRPWFQPQISTDTGHITGFEALARWSHPERGLISPAEFLPVLEQHHQMERLGEVMLYHALTALQDWDAAGIHIPSVGVNFSKDELRNPKLIDKIRWELDRFELPASRLTVEVLETVVAADPDDTVSRNINGLAKLGCGIDLDDFGTGHASISSIRRFAVTRIKIDRSFVMKVDRDPEQQRMVNAILTMADRLDLGTVAEGVETVGEHAMLAQLGCHHVQGFGIARPMPFAQTADWIKAHNAKLQQTPLIGRTAD